MPVSMNPAQPKYSPPYAKSLTAYLAARLPCAPGRKTFSTAPAILGRQSKILIFSEGELILMCNLVRLFKAACALSLILMCGAADSRPADKEYDIVIYGGTSGGAAAAIQASRMGKSVLLIEPGKHIGGLTSGALGATDIGNKKAIGGISREFYQRVKQHYLKPESWKQQKAESYRGRRNTGTEDTMWTFEPHVAEQIYHDMLKEAKVPVVFEERLNLKSGVTKKEGRIVAITMESGLVVRGKMFIDTTYEGDLMAVAGVSYHVGREANSVYKETLNGVQFGQRHHQFRVPVDPYMTPGDPKSGLLPGIHAGSAGEQGAGDNRVQAYNFRMCMTDVPENQIPWPKPAGYDPLRYELLLRYIQGGVWDALGSISPMPNRKTDTNNNGGFSTDNIGMNYDYPDGDYATRDRIFQEHVTYQQGMMWFLANDSRVPEKIRKDVSRWGLCKDEFPETGGWSHQMYIREARRLVAGYVMTQHNCQGREVANDPVGLAAYTMDSHNTQRFVHEGRALNEGDVQVGGFSPYPISYRSLVPKQAECTNLFVPVCLSASHISYGSIRMEPVFMVLGQSAATAAAHAIDEKVAVQQIDYKKLQARLLADKQVLEWTGPVRGSGRSVKSMAGTVLDDTQAKLTGDWGTSASATGYVGHQYLHDGNEEKGKKQATFSWKVKEPGQYEVIVTYSTNPNRATNVPVTIVDAEGKHTVRVNQRKKAPSGDMKSLGTYRFEKEGSLTISTEGTDGYVIVDAVQILSLKDKKHYKDGQ